MNYLVISDIHANFTALKAVLSDAKDYDAVWVLGDIVGYGPDPNECIEKVKSLPNLVCILGNHDAAVIDKIQEITFNPTARQVIYWTRSVINDENLRYLKNLPERKIINEVTLVHGSPREPVWEYLLDVHSATENFNYFDTPYCFIGHSHLPTLFTLEDEQTQARLTVPKNNRLVELQPRVIINPGSVGQPRDRDPRAAYAIFSLINKTVEFRRVEYDIQDVQRRMRQANLPHRQIERLIDGW